MFFSRFFLYFCRPIVLYHEKEYIHTHLEILLRRLPPHDVGEDGLVRHPDKTFHYVRYSKTLLLP